jgi:hypothetical protein
MIARHMMSGDPALVRYGGPGSSPASDLPAQTLSQRSTQLAATGLIVACQVFGSRPIATR